jgi:Trk K+ transport system NAD-binding subunit
LEAAHIDKAKLVISTIDSLSDNLVILEHITRLKDKPIILFTAGTRSNALRLYEKGADYVVVPEIVAGDHIRNLLRIYGIKSERLKKAGQNHFNRLIFS